MTSTYNSCCRGGEVWVVLDLRRLTRLQQHVQQSGQSHAAAAAACAKAAPRCRFGESDRFASCPGPRSGLALALARVSWRDRHPRYPSPEHGALAAAFACASPPPYPRARALTRLQKLHISPHSALAASCAFNRTRADCSCARVPSRLSPGPPPPLTRHCLKCP